ncbi:MAG: sporulation initiation factor Spo0A C-terminal domain-containing protein [Lachnospiraceae bacterium]
MRTITIEISDWNEKKLSDLLIYLKESGIQNISLSCGKLEDTENTKEEINISNVLSNVGVPVHLLGYQYIKTAIKYSLIDYRILESVTKQLYPTIAIEHRTSASKVEHAIRHAVFVAYNRRNTDVWAEIFGCGQYGLKGKPTNSTFIASLTDYISLHESASIDKIPS